MTVCLTEKLLKNSLASARGKSMYVNLSYSEKYHQVESTFT